MEEIKASRLFTDREEPRAAFWNQYDSLKAAMPCSSRVLTYYGIGGIGKTSLLEKLAEEMESPHLREKAAEQPKKGKKNTEKPRYVMFNFESYQECGTVLEKLKNLLRKNHGFTFPLFEIGSYLYAKKAGEDPETPEEKQLTDKNPGVKLAMDVAGEIPVVSTIARVLSFLDQGAAMIRTYRKTHPQELKELEQKTARQLREILPLLFARDLTRNLEKAQTPLVILLDTYERVVDELSTVGKPLNRDLWLRDANGVIPNTPNTLWVIAGRERLKWDEKDPRWKGCMEQHLLGELSAADGEGFLKRAGVEDEVLARQLYALTKGTPLYLDICAEQHTQLLEQGEKPDISMFGNDVEKLVERFVRYMDKSQKELVYMLSCMHSWDEDLVKEVASAVLKNYSRLDFKRIKGLSFVVPAGNDTYHIHRTVSQILQKDEDNDLQEETAEFLIGHFSQKILNETPFAPEYTEALHHMLHSGLQLYRESEALRAFYLKHIQKHIRELIRYGRYTQAEDVLNVLVERAEQDRLSRFYATVLMDHAWVLQKMKTDNYGAQKLASRAVILYTVLLGADHPDTLEATEWLANVMNDQGYSGKALQLTSRVLDKRKAIQGEDHPSTIATMTSYAGLLSAQGEHEQALPLLMELVEKHRQLYRDEDARTLRAVFDLAYTYAKVKQDSEAAALFEWLLPKSSTSLGEEHPQTTRVKSNLAKLYTRQERFAEALPLQEQVLQNCKKLYGEDYPDTVLAMQRMAKILCGLGREKEGYALLNKAEEKAAGFKKKSRGESLQQMFDRVRSTGAIWKSDSALEEKSELLRRYRQSVGPDHPDTLAAMENLAKALCDAGQQELAFILWEQALDKRRVLLGKNNPDLVDSLEGLCQEMGMFYRQDMEQYIRVVNYRKELLQIHEATLDKNDFAVIKAQYTLSLAFIHAERYEEALPLCETVLQMLIANREAEEDIWKAMEKLEKVYFELGRFEKALVLDNEMLQKLRSQPEANEKRLNQLEYRKLVIMSKMKRYSETIPQWEAMLERQRAKGDKDDFYILYQLAWDYADIGQIEKARELRNRIEEKRPGYLPMMDAQMKRKFPQ